jgi:hypothetical protein
MLRARENSCHITVLCISVVTTVGSCTSYPAPMNLLVCEVDLRRMETTFTPSRFTLHALALQRITYHALRMPRMNLTASPLTTSILLYTRQPPQERMSYDP